MNCNTIGQRFFGNNKSPDINIYLEIYHSPTILWPMYNAVDQTLRDDHLILRGRGGGSGTFWNKYFDLGNAENKLSVFFWKENK